MITVVSFKSPPRETPFAPEWFHQFAYDQIYNIDFEKISATILDKEKQILNKFPPVDKVASDGYTGLGNNSLTSRYSYYNLFDWADEEIQKLKTEVWDFHKRFLESLDVVYDHPLVLKGWANVMRKGERIKSHIHMVTPQSYLTGHITVQAEGTSTYYINPVNQINDPEVREVKNISGRISLLPAYIPHYTDTHKAEKERISIGIDVIPKE